MRPFSFQWDVAECELLARSFVPANCRAFALATWRVPRRRQHVTSRCIPWASRELARQRLTDGHQLSEQFRSCKPPANALAAHQHGFPVEVGTLPCRASSAPEAGYCDVWLDAPAGSST